MNAESAHPAGTLSSAWDMWSYQIHADSKLALRSRAEFEAQLGYRALKDPEFADYLKRDPKGAMEQECGIALPKELTIDIVRESAGVVYWVVPHNPLLDFELGEEMQREMDLVGAASWAASQQRASLHQQGSAPLIARAWTDPSFRERLLIAPREVLMTELHLEFADDTEIVAVMESGNHLYFVLPAVDDPVALGTAISDLELDDIAGKADALVDIFGSTTCANCSSHTVGACCCLITK